MKNRKTRLAKGVLLISFVILFIRLIYASIRAFDHYKNNCSTCINTKQQ